MAKDFIEDRKRHDSDLRENSELYSVFRDGSFQMYPAHSIRVGEIIRLKKGDHLPCDILCVHSSGVKGECLIETKNLDGETNLKKKLAPKDSNKLSIAEIAAHSLFF